MSAPHLADATLRAYALGDLPLPAQQAAEGHVLGCPLCRAQVIRWRDDFAAQVDALPSAGRLPPLRRPHGAPAKRHLPPRWSALTLPGLLMLSVLALGWGGWQQHQASALRAEQRQVAGWLAQPQLKVLAMQDTKRRPTGQLLLLPSREVLFVLPPPAPGKVYQVWVAAHWHRGDKLTPQLSSRRGTFSASVGENDYVCVSLEDAGRQPTKPSRILGWSMV
ncbi:hypothetical protein DKM44_10395 [Deinococcus irradiatisoli]|uniref:Anti-sigma factor n=1 Tax=Deinococcus irradiatisoli TaxID=2202254 RepID=A0A2Z3JEG7_9DEIO|nr:hypothetical protein [Deinococcus irradiatisoli]AWN23587.1 hypothetical protein DKM44_10395 [Deinococcus irradiatisoli]